MFLLTLFLTLPAVAAAPPAEPNVVMIIGDDQGWMDFGFMGSKEVATPNLDRLAAESAVYPNSYVPTSLCRASLATLLTGLYPHEHKICVNDPPEGVDRSAMHTFIQSVPTVPRMLAEAGYASFQTGKLWEGHYVNAGFTDGMTVKGRHGDDGLVIGRETMKPIFAFLAKNQSKPFFVWYAPMLPHEPHNPPERLRKKYAVAGRHEKVAKYYAMCEWFDETCGTLLRHLDVQGLADNTLVVFVVDNGWIQETRPTRTTRGWFTAKSKLSPYDGGVRTPILLRWPGRIKKGLHEDLISSIDLAPTILAAGGIKPDPGMQGINLLPNAMEDKPVPRDVVYGEIFKHTSVDLDNPAKSLLYRWARKGDWKVIVPTDSSKTAELYDLSKDPLEENNLSSQNPDKVRDLSSLLDAWWPGH